MAYFANTDNAPSKFLSGVGFQLSLNKLPGVSYYCQSATVPSLNLAVADQPTMYRRLPEPGDEINYDDLSIRFLVDEDMKNYISIHNWLRYLGYPESNDDWTTFNDGETYDEMEYIYGQVLGQFRRYMGHVATNIGGVYQYYKTSDQDGAVYTHVDKNHQKACVNFLNKHLFETPYWMIDKNILNKIEYAGTTNRIRSVQSSYLSCLLYTSPSPRDLSTSRMPSSA